jgi:hypothetical protein
MAVLCGDGAILSYEGPGVEARSQVCGHCAIIRGHPPFERGLGAARPPEVRSCPNALRVPRCRRPDTPAVVSPRSSASSAARCWCWVLRSLPFWCPRPARSISGTGSSRRARPSVASTPTSSSGRPPTPRRCSMPGTTPARGSTDSRRRHRPSGFTACSRGSITARRSGRTSPSPGWPLSRSRGGRRGRWRCVSRRCCSPRARTPCLVPGSFTSSEGSSTSTLQGCSCWRCVPRTG